MARQKKVQRPSASKQKVLKNGKLPVPALFFVPKTLINRDVLTEVKNIIKKSSNKQVYLVVKSAGGDAYSAVRIMRHIRTKYTQVVGVVPDYAYSAASLMLLGANKILVSPEGYIAPIDKPMEHAQSGVNISALDVTQSITNLSTLVKQNAVGFYESMRGEQSDFPETISKKEALRLAWQNSVDLIKPLVSQIDPILLQKCYRDLRIGLYYGMDLLGDYMLPNNFDLCFKIVNKLVNVFPSHGYAIFREEMKKLGLVIENFEDNRDYSRLSELYNKTNGIVFIDNIYD